MSTPAKIRVAAQSLWAEISKAQALYPTGVLKVTMPCIYEDNDGITIDSNGLAVDVINAIHTQARNLSDALFSIPCVLTLGFGFCLSGDGTVEFTNVIESHEDIHDGSSSPTVPEFFESFAKRIIDAEGETDEGPVCLQNYTVTWFHRGDDLTANVPATCAKQAAKLYAAVMDICFFSEHTFKQIRDVTTAGKTADWKN